MIVVLTLLPRALRDSGIEVIYTGLHQTIPAIVDAAIQEDVEVIGLSILSGTHLSFSRKLIKELEVRNTTDFIIIVGGTIPEGDVQKLVEIGIDEVFPVGTPLSTFPDKLKTLVREKRARS